MPLLCPRCRTRQEGPESRCPSDGWRLVQDRAGERIGERFDVEDLLGVGAAGTVWRARDTQEGGVVALKLLSARVPAEVQRFERAARLVAGLDHPSIARTIAHGRESDLLWVAMDLLEGETVADLQQRVGRFEPVEAARIVGDVLLALGQVHAQGVVHRDLKPSNLFLARETRELAGAVLRVKIVDFGIAKPAGMGEVVAGPFAADDEDQHADEEVTGRHRICGTPEYMAPEQILGGPADVRSDLYAVGVVLHKLLTGVVPFRARSRNEIYHMHVHAELPPFAPELAVPPALEQIVRQALAKRAADRFADAWAMRTALFEAVGLPIAGREPVIETPPSRVALPRPTPRPSARRGWAIAFFVFSLVVLGGVLITKLGPSEPASEHAQGQPASAPARP